MSFSWTCPFCNHKATITSDNQSCKMHQFKGGNKHGFQAVKVNKICCPNDECMEYTLDISLHDHVETGSGYKHEAKRNWSLIPQSQAKVFPPYVPEAIVTDYTEACAIQHLSAKSSATLARRCIQGMIRDFWSVKKGRLIDEINAIEEKVDPMTWAAIDAIRKIGNIGAHMEKDINIIIDVEPQEANLLIGLIETLINDWYVVREERKIRLEAIVGLAEQKHEARKNA